MLTNVPTINQNEMLDVFRYTIDNKCNCLILGPSGGGKTEMCLATIEEKKCLGIYVNMAVLERTDFQGMPVVSSDKKSVSYATPEFLPFSDVRLRNKKEALAVLAGWVGKQSGEFNQTEAFSFLQTEIKRIELEEEITQLRNSVGFLNDDPKFKELNDRVSQLDFQKNNDTPIVFIFDEVDKAIPEVLQTLLEFLQFRSINGRKLNIHACILTANLPDEHAHTQQISHAITKRGMTFRLQLDFKLWKEWAIANNISPLITGFLNQNEKFFYSPPSSDDTEYAQASPRTWTAADKVIKYFENLEKSNVKFNVDLRDKLIAGNVGENAANNFTIWYQHYYQLDPFVFDLLEKKVYPNVADANMSTQDIFVCALSACSKLESSLKVGNEAVYKKYTVNIFSWLATLPPDVQIGSVRMIFGNNFDSSKGQAGLVSKFKLSEIPEFVDVFKDISMNIRNWEKINAARP